MQTRRLGNTDLELTTVGLGTWAIGGPWEFGWGPQDDDNSIATILTAIEGGINWIDTAPVYGCGHSEDVVGRAIKQLSEKPLSATKCGLLWDEDRRRCPCLKAESIMTECEMSLRRLGVEVIDLYQMHWPQPAEQIEEAWGAMAECVKQGKVRYIGVSNFTVDQLKLIEPIYPPASLQPTYSMVRRDFEKQLLGYCDDKNIGVVCYSPMQRGLLTGKFSEQRLAQLPDNDHRKTNPDFQQPRFGATLELVDKLRPIAERNGRTLAQLAIAWVLRRKEVTAAIVGARRKEQIEETISAGDWQLGANDIAQIEILLQQHSEKVEL